MTRTILAVLIALSPLLACKKPSQQTGATGENAPAATNAAKPISIKGSDTMVTLGQRWAEVYMQKHQDEVIQVTGGGSGTGISALINGTTDICQASRKMKDKEVELLRTKYSHDPVEIEVAKDGLAVYVHAGNPVQELSFAQLKDIFTAKITNWKDVGGPDQKIIVYSRENSSGTYVFFKEVVLDGADFAVVAQTMPGTAAVVNAVSKEAAGIGYGGAAYAKGIKIVKVRKAEGEPAIEASEATVKDGTYPLARPLYFYLGNEPAGRIKAFVDWTLSPEGQALVAEVGYYPIH